MQLLEDMNVEYKSYKRTCLHHCTSASGQIMQEKWSALDT